MSKIKLQGNASGTGILTIESPNTNTDRSLTLPDGAGEIVVLDNWTISEDGSGNLIFATNGTDTMKLDTSGNLTVIGDVTAFGTI